MRHIPRGIAYGMMAGILFPFGVNAFKSAGNIVQLFAVLPKAFVAVLAGLALIGTIMANLMGEINEADHREASIITFLVTASGMTFLSLGSAF